MEDKNGNAANLGSLWSIVGQRILCPATVSSGTGNTTSSCTSSSTADNNDAATAKWDEDAERATTTILFYLIYCAEHSVEVIRNQVEL